MQLHFLKAKLHNVKVTETDLHYNGSVSIDEDFLKASGIHEFEKVDIYNITNGSRFTTYTIKAEAGSKKIGINGAAAHLVNIGDAVIICAYCSIDKSEIESINPTVIKFDDKNNITND
ncbi:MAG: aspartate 1-decarboxylase [Rickettsiales bacterium]|nr:aspartate 1-decarboxylase [Rickettsiales bacterium]